MKNEIIGGYFPRGSNIDFTNYLLKDDMEISWVEDGRTNSFELRGNVDRVEIDDKSQTMDDGLTPLEGGIIGGSVAGPDGFLAGYLSLSGDEDGVVFICNLKDGRSFTANCSPEIYNKLVEFSYK
ncbi:MAG: hypothetical protein ACYCXB_07100 [Candidatus Humimicrobiaceae bacterium]